MIYGSAFEIIFDRIDYIVQSVEKFAYKAFVFAYYSVNEILVVKQFIYDYSFVSRASAASAVISSVISCTLLVPYVFEYFSR